MPAEYNFEQEICFFIHPANQYQNGVIRVFGSKQVTDIGIHGQIKRDRPTPILYLQYERGDSRVKDISSKTSFLQPQALLLTFHPMTPHLQKKVDQVKEILQKRLRFKTLCNFRAC